MSSEAEAPEAPAVDEARQGLLDRLTRHLGDAVLASHIDGGDMWVRIDRARWRDAARICRDELDLRYFCFLGGMDWLDNPDLSGEKIWDPDGAVVADATDADGESADSASPAAEPAAAPAGTWVTGVAGGDTRFQVFLRLYSIAQKLGLTLKVDLDSEDPRVDSIAEVFRGADWHEREAWEMYGFQFDGHPGLRHIYLPGEFEGYPLRKDFPLLAREVKPWPGLVDVEPMPGEPEGDAEATEGAEA